LVERSLSIAACSYDNMLFTYDLKFLVKRFHLVC